MPNPGLTPAELAHDLLTRIEQGNAYARSRKNRFRSSSSAVKVVSLILTVASTIILGLQNLNAWTGTAFSLVAIVTAVNTLEPFFAWRSRCVLMEEAQYKVYRLRDQLTYYIAASQTIWINQSFRACSTNTSKSGISSVTAGWSTGKHPADDNGRSVASGTARTVLPQTELDR